MGTNYLSNTGNEICQSREKFPANGAYGAIGRKFSIGKYDKLMLSLEFASREEKQPGDVIHLDLKGPLEDVGYEGSKYAAIFVDEASRFTLHYVLSHIMQGKSRCLPCL